MFYGTSRKPKRVVSLVCTQCSQKLIYLVCVCVGGGGGSYRSTKRQVKYMAIQVQYLFLIVDLHLLQTLS